MKFTLSWLKEHLETNASLDEIVEALTDLGLEVESVENPLERLQGFTIGYVLEAEKHPDADRLRVCKVDTDTGPLQIICGAPNARAGITVVVAKPGLYVPGIDTTIGVGKIRGVESHGMMCSERELELSDEHEGIIELPSGKVGETFADWLSTHDPSKVDPVIEIAITPNRPDALGVHGVARDLAARGLGRLMPRTAQVVPATLATEISVTIDADTSDGCPVFAGRVIQGVKNGPSPQWLQARLKAIGLRPINVLVDVTNFFTYDLNRPLHVFDLEKVKGNLRVHRAQGGEDILALDGKTYRLSPGQMVISDDNGPESIAGVMGGEHTGCSEATTTVFVESAYWDPVQIALTGRALKIHSDARYRFERGIDPAFTVDGLEHAVRMIVDIAGGEASDLIMAGSIPNEVRRYTFDPKRCLSLVGMDIPEKTQRRILTDLGFTLDGDMAEVPSWRPDIQTDVDLVEEVARVASLTKLEGQPMHRPAGVQRPVLTKLQKRERAVRRSLAALGYNECVTYSFIDQTAAELYGGGTQEYALANPISQDMSHLRPALLPGLLKAAVRNKARGFENLALCEIGAVFHGGEPGEQGLCASGVLIGHTGPKDHFGGRRPIDIFDIKADVQTVLSTIGAPAKTQMLRDLGPQWHPGRSGRICLGPKTTLAAFGEIHPKVLQAFDVKGPAVGFTIWLENIPIPKNKTTTRAALHLNDLQIVERDFAFVLDAHVEALTLVNAAAGADKTLIEDVRVFDEFIGGNLGDGKKSLAITVRLQPQDKTLTEAEITAVSAKIIEKVQKVTGGVLRD